MKYLFIKELKFNNSLICNISTDRKPLKRNYSNVSV